MRANHVTLSVHTQIMSSRNGDLAEDSGDMTRCSECGGPLLPVEYGFPGSEMFEAAARGEIVLGGCTIGMGDPTHSCGCGVTTMGVDPGWDPVEVDIDEARSYIGSVRWQTAKTMPQWPHEYTVRKWQPDLEDTFEAFAALTRSAGVVKPWPADSPTPRYHHRYLAIDGWDYWIMDGPVAETEVINRARLDTPE